MNKNDFDVVNETETAHGLVFNKKLIIVVLVILVVAIFLLISLLNKSNAKYSLEVPDLYIFYMDEPLEIPFELKGPEENTKVSQTAYSSETDEVIDTFDGEIYGAKGSMLLEPISVGEDYINIVSTTGIDDSTEVLAEKRMHVIVCPKFDNSLLVNNKISIKKGATEKINLNFNKEECYNYLTYSSGNSSVITVNENGVITGVNSGTAIITISNGYSLIYLTVNVVD